MRYFYDTEFLDDGKTVTPISIGVVAEDGREFYGVLPNAMDTCKKSEWLFNNVAPTLPLDPYDNRLLDFRSPLVKPKNTLKAELYKFLSHDMYPSLWGWFVSYDHLVLSQLWGKMIDVPAPIPQFSNDLKTLGYWYGIKKYPVQMDGQHNALADARHNKVVFDYIMKEIGNG